MWYIVFLRGFSPVSYGVYFFCFATAYDKGCARMFPPSKVVSGFRVCLGSLDRGLGYFRVQGVPAGGGGVRGSSQHGIPRVLLFSACPHHLFFWRGGEVGTRSAGGGSEVLFSRQVRKFSPGGPGFRVLRS